MYAPNGIGDSPGFENETMSLEVNNLAALDILSGLVEGRGQCLLY